MELVIGTVRCNSDANVKIPSSISFDALKQFGVCYYNNFDRKQLSDDGTNNTGKIILKDNNTDYSIENNIAIKNDGTEMIFLCLQKYDIDNFIISEKLKNIASLWIYYKAYLGDYLKDNAKITLDENNPYYIISGDVLYSSTRNIYINEDFSKKAQKENFCIVSPLKSNSNIILDGSLVEDKDIMALTYRDFYGDIIISDNYSNINFKTNLAHSSYVVSPKNQYFSEYRGNLYTKDFSKLLQLDSKEYEHMYIDKNIEDIAEGCYYRIHHLIDDEKIHLYVLQNDLVLDNKILYSTKYKKMIATGSCDNITIIDCIEDISENVMNWIYLDSEAKNVTISVSGDNKYFEEQDGFVFKNGKEKLIFGPNSRKYLYITKETKEIDERLLARFNNYFVDVDPTNEYFEMYKGNLYTKGREKLLAICNNYEDIVEESLINEQVLENGESQTSNEMNSADDRSGHYATMSGDDIVISDKTQNITKQAIQNMINRKIIVETGNLYYEVYKDNLYSLGKERLVAIGNANDDNEDFRYVNAELHSRKTGKVLDHIKAQIGKTIILAKEVNEIDSNLAQILEIPNEKIIDFYREYEVEDGNKTFASYDGCLYNNDLTQMLFIRGGSVFGEYVDKEKIKIPLANIEYSDSIKENIIYYEFKYER